MKNNLTFRASKSIEWTSSPTESLAISAGPPGRIPTTCHTPFGSLKISIPTPQESESELSEESQQSKQKKLIVQFQHAKHCASKHLAAFRSSKPSFRKVLSKLSHCSMRQCPFSIEEISKQFFDFKNRTRRTSQGVPKIPCQYSVNCRR